MRFTAFPIAVGLIVSSSALAQQISPWSRHFDRLEVRISAGANPAATWLFYRGESPSMPVSETGLSLAPGREVAVRVVPPAGDAAKYELVRTERGRDSEDFAHSIGLDYIDPIVLRLKKQPFRLAVLRRAPSDAEPKEVGALVIYPADRWNSGGGMDVVGGAIQNENITFAVSPIHAELISGMSLGAYVLTVPGRGWTIDPNTYDQSDTFSGGLPDIHIPELSVGAGLSWHFPLGTLWGETGVLKPLQVTVALGLRGIDEHQLSAVPFLGVGLRVGF